MSARLLRIHQWDQLAWDADFEPAKMATLCCVSLRQLQRFFAEQHQQTPRQWLRELRCELAKELISQGFSTKAAAAELKFGSESHFCREFKRVFKASPQTFAPTYTGRTRLSPANNNVA